jgi:hypothetical protein
MEEAKARTGVRVAPITLVGEKVFYGTFPLQKPGLIPYTFIIDKIRYQSL